MPHDCFLRTEQINAPITRESEVVVNLISRTSSGHGVLLERTYGLILK